MTTQQFSFSDLREPKTRKNLLHILANPSWEYGEDEQANVRAAMALLVKWGVDPSELDAEGNLPENIKGPFQDTLRALREQVEATPSPQARLDFGES